ncbi:DUF2971 domain-containing protein [Fluviicola taffensis]|uniref:DUF2971 domain-containing protein n=1 Tax=Fluviicola taffensis (strain DSM 16823 / NCIMB 13979 / RW262) TaxID=755732 RepID=F2IEP7_FLUTR|nr:DUF2971 domain-containing protein [Fluviicola taffensis]AEA45614.1 hypothetical protein Fluta_3645 [Fluviicola taffensis DSM 16823]
MSQLQVTQEKYIYKYFPINEFLFRVLINNELFFANPFNFNDPFDCQFQLNLIEGSEAEQEWNRNLDSVLTESDHLLIDRLNLRNNLASGLTPHFIEGVSKLIGVTCFSEKPDNFLMWSHYGASHSGVCLKFDWRMHKEYFQGTRVVYEDNLPVAEYSSSQGFQDQIPRIVLTKLTHWSYENEVRSVITTENNKRTPSFNPKSLSGVIFGDKTNNTDIELIKRIIALHGEYSNIEFYKANLLRTESRINISKLE